MTDVTPEDLVADVRLARAGPSRDGNGFDIDLLVPHEISAVLVHSFRAVLDEHGDAAPNYVEMAVDYEGDRYAVIVLRPGRKTPHQLRAEAEAERDALREQVGALQALLYLRAPAKARLTGEATDG